MSNNKALTIDVNTSAIPNGTLDKWSTLSDTTVFIDNIQTPKLSSTTNVGQLVSGIPTAFARVDLFKTALDYVATNDDASGKGNLVAYYLDLVDEWCGLIACLALDYAHISVRRINLQYSDGESIDTTSNLYESKGAFGNMLLGRKLRWCEQNVNDNQTLVPFINVIKYKNGVVGATAPESLLFTSTGYSCQYSAECPWISAVTGKFINPLKSSMSASQVAALHAYVSNILKSLNSVTEYYQELPPELSVDYTSIRSILSKWKEAIEQYAKRQNFDLSIGSIPPVNAEFAVPFNKLFCHKDSLIGLEGVISEEPTPGGIVFDPKNLLLDDSARIARLDINVSPENFKNLPILALSAKVKNTAKNKAFFALPLSAEGLNVYGKNVAALVGMSGSTTAITSTLEATYDPTVKSDNLEVVLTIKTESGTQRQFKKIYTSDGGVKNKDILIWPNFVSPQWDAYFMYNELPHNGKSQSYRAFPFVGEMQNNYFRILVDDQNAPVLLSKDGKIVAPQNQVNSELLILSNEGVADNLYKYEIYRSDKPFKGVRLLSPTGNEGGYLLINYSSAQGTQLPHDWMRPGATPNLRPVRLGIDFGSTNTSIAYSSDTTQEQGFYFENQRVSLFGKELAGTPLIPRENQVFFFQGIGPKVKSNAIKSVLTLHDNRRLPDLKQGQSLKMRDEREVIGGFPSFSDNLPFSNSSKNTITLHYPNGVGDVTQIHNMKWEDTDADKAHKSAFLRTLMLQVYATLFVKGFVPDTLKWSYPSAMAGQLLYSYQNIWQSLSSVSPILRAGGQHWPLNISKYIDNRAIGDTSFVGGFGGDVEENFGMTEGCFGSQNVGFGAEVGGFGISDEGFGTAGNSFGTADNVFDTQNSGFGVVGNGFSDIEGDFGDFSRGQSENSTHKKSDMLPDDLEKEISYKPEPLYSPNASQTNPSLSEAESVANFISVKYGKEANVLNLCFDVGGSTTDISALFYLNNGITMIKQNSLRFAAQRVSQSVANFPKFREVLNSICSQFDIQMVGLNYGPDSYNTNTAPYFFDQIVNRLSDEQLEVLYQHISSNCPQLMCVNMYVTGLLMYYAGQIAHKLVDDLKRTPESEWPAKRKPNVRVTFAGKGSRLFQWLKVINSKVANQYYGEMFVKGYGLKALKESLAGWQNIQLPNLGEIDIKYEVSKGLAKGDSILLRPTNEQPSEIIGETGFEVIGNDNIRRPLDFLNSISSEMLESIGTRFCVDNVNHKQADNFTEFCGFFYSAASQLFNWKTDPKVLLQACRDMNITAYVQNMPEFRCAVSEAQQSGRPFDFVAPIIILEGMKFYDNVLLKML